MFHKKLSVWIVSVVGILSLGTIKPAYATLQAFIRFDGIVGESQQSRRLNWTDVLRFSQDLNVTIQAGGLAAGKVNAGDFKFGKRIDQSSPQLNFILVNGTQIPQVVFEIERSLVTGVAGVYARYTFNDVRLTSIQITGDDSLMSVPSEDVSFNCHSLRWEIIPYNAAGNPGPTISAGWDFANNAPLPSAPTPTPSPGKTAVPTKTPTKTPTSRPLPTPTTHLTGTTLAAMDIPLGSVVVMDDLRSTEDLSNGQDKDSSDNRELVIRWNLNFEYVVDFQVYVQVDSEKSIYMGHTGSGKISYLDWKPNASTLVDPFLIGPQTGHSYLFFVSPLITPPSVKQPIAAGQFPNAGPVAYKVE